MRKRSLSYLTLLLIGGFLGVLPGSKLLAAQFYQPNRAARLSVALKNKASYAAGQPIPVTVMLTNQAMTPLLINSRMLTNLYPLEGELSFVIQGPQGKTYSLAKVVSPREISANDLSVLRVGQTMEQIADLNDLYGLHKRGKYRIQAIYYNRTDFEKDGLRTWRGTIASEPAEFLID